MSYVVNRCTQSGSERVNYDMTRRLGSLQGKWLIALCALVIGSACGDGGGSKDPVMDPCGGACPADECFAGTCVVVEPDVGPDAPDTDTGEDDADVGDDADVDPDAERKDCETDDDCPETSFCLVAGNNETGACQIGCREGGCEDGQLCDLETRECSDGCREDGDCGDEEFCAVPEDADLGACREGCRTDDQCPGELTCLPGSGVCVGVECNDDELCPPNFFCDSDLAHCVPGCTDDAHCEDGTTCVEGACVGMDCEEDDDCPEAQFCGDELRCAPGCRDDATCEFGQICPEDTRICRDGCREDGDCDLADYCEPTELACVEGCRDDDSCVPGNSCLEVAIDEDETMRRRCVPTPCTSDVECLDDFYCAIPQDEDEGECAVGCRLGDDCPVGFQCDEETRQCVDAPCNDSDECPLGFFCDPELETPTCVPGCDGNGQCPNDQPCDVETNTCGCGTDLDCAQSQVCDRGMCVQACTEHTDCGDGFFCEFDSGLCLEGCYDDDFEPNDTREDAMPIDTGQFDMRMCYGAEINEDYHDCFHVELGEEDELMVTAVFDSDVGDLDLNVYDPGDNIVAQGLNPDGREEITYEAPAAGQYTFCLFPQGNGFEFSYQLNVAVVRGQGCLDDADEADGNDTCEDVQGDALDLAFGQPHTRANRTICDSDEDYVAVNLLEGQQLDVEVSRTCGGGALDVQILDVDCQSVLARSDGDEVQRTVTVIAPVDGTYTVRTFAPLFGDEACYSANFLLSAGNAVCRDDQINNVPLEPNDDADNATLLDVQRGEPETFEGFAVCVEDEDWYSVLIQTPGDVLRATVCQNINDDPLRVEIRADGGNTLLVADEANGMCKTAETMPVNEPGIYYVRVLPTGDIVEPGIRYDLTVVSDAAEACLPDNFEPNETLEDASNVVGGQHTGTLCRGEFDQDWYRFELNSGDQVNITLTYDHEITQLGAVLYDTNGDIADILFPDEVDPDLDVLASGAFFVGQRDAGNWYLEVPTFQEGAALPYTVDLSIESPDCEDEFEETPNNSCEMGEDLSPFTDVRGFVCGPVGDEDWFCTDVAANQALTFRVEHFHFQGNLELEVHRPCGTLLDFSYNSGEDFEQVTIDNTEEGTYCARVFARSTVVQNRYTIEATIE